MHDDEPIPLVDLAAQHREIADEVHAAFDQILARTAYIGGPDVGAFEREFAAYCGLPQCVGVANGTDAIELGLRAAGLERGDEVILPANTFIATAEAVERAGGTVVLVDCDPVHLLLEPKAIEERLSGRTRAVIGVDLFGQLAPFELIRDAVRGRDVFVAEDAAQSQGATRHGRPIGHGVRFASTSFYPGKNLGAYGDGGAVLTDDVELAQTVRALGSHGGLRKYEHLHVGCNSRLDTLQAAVLRAKLRRLNGWNERRGVLAARYSELLRNVPGVELPTVDPANTAVWHLFVVRVAERDNVLAQLHDAKIGAGIHYPVPVHLTAAFAHLGHGPGDFPVAEAAAASMISLPLHAHLSDAQQDRVVATLTAALR
ncbi:MAG: DegT/DnrJ/EryC1/StrS family aminotransferase [Acidimicrobiales bacterium]